MNFALTHAILTVRYCVKQIMAHVYCDGKCYLIKQLKKRQTRKTTPPIQLRKT
jgi:hypothetical protein